MRGYRTQIWFAVGEYQLLVASIGFEQNSLSRDAYVQASHAQTYLFYLFSDVYGPCEPFWMQRIGYDEFCRPNAEPVSLG